MQRRQFMQALIGTLACSAMPAWAVGSPTQTSATSSSRTRIGAAWRGLAATSSQKVGILDIDWASRKVDIAATVTVPSRAHGFLAEADGNLLAMAFRPGPWLLRMSPTGQRLNFVQIADESSQRRFSGHMIHSAEGSALLTTEYDPRTGAGWIGVRDPRTLKKLDEWPSHGKDPHQLLLTPQGDIVIANGGVPRSLDGQTKLSLANMDSSLVLLDGRNGTLRGQWRLPDSRLSLRHMAWNTLPGQSAPVLGIALQAEHDDREKRLKAPILALWDSLSLTLPNLSADAGGYAGDIAPAKGGFILSAQTSHHALWWQHDSPKKMQVIARMQEACALCPNQALTGGVLIAGARGIGRWHAEEAASLLPWPEPIALDNHWVTLPLV